MTWNDEAARHLRGARLALIEGGLRGADEKDRALAAYNDLMALCKKHELVIGEASAEPARRLRRVA